MQQQASPALGRRQALGMVALLAAPAWAMGGAPAAKAAELQPVDIQIALTPDQSLYDPTETELREAALALQGALDASDVVAEEAAWTAIIEKYGGLDRPWVPDVVGRAWGNRGNARSRQGKLQAALDDYEQAIKLCPWSVDPVLNRGVVLEALGRWDEAVRDYKSVLAVAPGDPAAWNNLGNAQAGLGNWDEAETCYGRAAVLAPNFAFASANHALASFQLGKTNEATREMRALLRRYPDFVDMRAALAAALWSIGKEGDAESNWERVDDPRYRDRVWLAENRRWPPRLLQAMEEFRALRSMAA